jgi:hypothetical protein
MQLYAVDFELRLAKSALSKSFCFPASHYSPLWKESQRDRLYSWRLDFYGLTLQLQPTSNRQQTMRFDIRSYHWRHCLKYL